MTSCCAPVRHPCFLHPTSCRPHAACQAFMLHALPCADTAQLSPAVKRQLSNTLPCLPAPTCLPCTGRGAGP